MRPGRKNGIKPDGWKIELELGNKQDLLEIGKAKLGGDHKSEQYKSSLSKNDKVDPPHNTQKIIAESLGNKQDLLEIGREKKVQDGKDSRAIQLGVLSINDKTLEPPHNTQKIIAGNDQA